MSLPELTNAYLTLVTQRGFTDDYDRDATPGATKFTGSQRVFWKESSERELFATGGGASTDVIIERTMLVDPEIGVAWEQGDIVTVTRDKFGQITAVVKDHATAGSDEVGWVTRVRFEDA